VVKPAIAVPAPAVNPLAFRAAMPALDEKVMTAILTDFQSNRVEVITSRA
jgi:hypothetical protein